ncbi:hypothetical protein A7H1H_0668 [Aliarcobacter butzleri 7h1h]|nr:hypothetical protein [Aliarcobacter butzleri]AGR76980.1 hypothetical protein A7H1H_0668 [Aliarcobacter butzleri 7h1h]
MNNIKFLNNKPVVNIEPFMDYDDLRKLSLAKYLKRYSLITENEI